MVEMAWLLVPLTVTSPHGKLGLTLMIDPGRFDTPTAVRQNSNHGETGRLRMGVERRAPGGRR